MTFKTPGGRLLREALFRFRDRRASRRARREIQMAFFPPRPPVDDDGFDSYRRDLKMRMARSFGPDRCTLTPFESHEQVVAAIRRGEADVDYRVMDSGEHTRYYAVRFNDRELGDAAREDSLWLFGRQ